MNTNEKNLPTENDTEENPNPYDIDPDLFKQIAYASRHSSFYSQK